MEKLNAVVEDILHSKKQILCYNYYNKFRGQNQDMNINNALMSRYRMQRNLAKKLKTDTGEGSLGDNFDQVENEYYLIYLDYLENLIINLITYENVPVTFNQRWLEYCLRYYGYCRIGFTDAEHIFVAGETEDNGEFGFGKLDVNNLGYLSGQRFIDNPYIPDDKLPLINRIDAHMGINKGYVAIANKFAYFGGALITNYTDFLMIDRVAKTLAKIKATEMNNVEFMKMQYLGLTNNKNLTARNIFNQINNGALFIQVDQDLGDLDNVLKVNNFNVQDFLPTLNAQFNKEFQELLTVLGINTVGIDKKERLVTAEADSNAQLTEASANVYIDARQEQIDVINECLGTNINVTFNQEAYEQLVQLNQNIGYRQAENDEQHDNEKD